MPIFKQSLDLEFLKEISPTGGGMRGTYYSKIPKEYAEKLKQLGTIDPTVGIKVFDSPFFGDDLQEYLSLHFISPQLLKLGIKCTYTTEPLSISNFLQNQYTSIKHIEGVHLDKVLPYIIYSKIKKYICSNLEKRMEGAGIIWEDCQMRNYLIKNSTAKMLQKEWGHHSRNAKFLNDQLADSFMKYITPEIINSVAIVDMGSFRCKTNSEVGKAITAFRDKVYDFMKSKNFSDKVMSPVMWAFKEILQ